MLVTVDLEDWFQVENFRPCCPVSSWSSHQTRVERNTHRILDVLDDVSDLLNRKRMTHHGEQAAISDDTGTLHATFFVLGWVARRFPHLVCEIQARGHEVASHGYGHELCTRCSREQLRKDLTDSKKILEDIIGDQVYGYRSPSFSISDEILDLIEEAGYAYDSSYNSFGIHGRYGKISLNGHARRGNAYKVSEGFYELPISNLGLGKRVLPWGGGAYFRLIPGTLFTLGVREILRRRQTYLFYLHPWEMDPDQPRVEGITSFSKFKHYTNLNRTEDKLRHFLPKFSECCFVTCHEHLEDMTHCSARKKGNPPLTQMGQGLGPDHSDQ